MVGHAKERDVGEELPAGALKGAPSVERRNRGSVRRGVGAAVTRDVLVHVHGVRDIDFSSMSPTDLERVEYVAAELDVDLVPTVFLARDFLPQFEQVMKKFGIGASQAYPHILGFAVEGPMLGTGGGVPPAGCWVPSGQEWKRIAALGEYGLQYMVIGPDALELEAAVAPGLTFRDVVDSFYVHDVKLALGHFQHDDPARSAERTVNVIDYVQATYGPSAEALITDHLFNDMPRRFIHAWRTHEARQKRDRELHAFLSRPWREEDLDDILGPVPAVLLRAAARGRLTPVLNFDGEHVDLAICRRVVDHLGSQNMMAITDHTDSDTMAGEPLSITPGSTLRYRSDGIVAAGSSGPGVQRTNMASIGLTESDISNLLENVPRRVLSHRVQAA